MKESAPGKKKHSTQKYRDYYFLQYGVIDNLCSSNNAIHIHVKNQNYNYIC